MHKHTKEFKHIAINYYHYSIEQEGTLEVAGCHA